MVRTPCCEKMGMKKGPWTPEEDQILVSYIQHYGHANWRALPRQAGLLRCGKSCRLRWINYLRPDIKRGNFTKEEEETILKLHQLLGNRWSTMAAKLPGRTDNEIKNYWHTHLKKKLLRNASSSNYSLTSNSISHTINYNHHNNIGFVHSNKLATNVNPMDLITTSPPSTSNNMVPVIQSLSHARDQDEQSTAKEDATWKLVSKCSATTNATLLLDHHNYSSRTMNNDERRVSDGSKNVIDDEEIMEFWYNLFVGSSGDQVPSRLLINGQSHFGCC